MRNLKVKVCGITRVEDALAACRSGADFIGFIFAQESPRCIKPELAAEISSAIGTRARKVGVFVDENPSTVIDVARFANLDLVQLHGNESPELCSAIPYPVIKALEVDDDFDALAHKDYFHQADYLLLDLPRVRKSPRIEIENNQLSLLLSSFNELQEVFPSVSVFLAGGLRAGMNWRSLDELSFRKRPFGIDVCRAVEVSPGVKNPDLIKSFIETTRGICI